LQIFEEFFDISGKVRKNELWPDVSQGSEHEAASCDPRMRYGKVGFGERDVVIVKQIYVDCPGAVFLLIGRPAEVSLDAFEAIEKFVRPHFAGQFERGVEEQRRCCRAADGRSLVDLGAKYWLRSIVKAEKAATGGLEIKEARLDIGPESNSGAHVFQ
jgi:hypothetical protein